MGGEGEFTRHSRAVRAVRSGRGRGGKGGAVRLQQPTVWAGSNISIIANNTHSETYPEL